MTVPDWAKRQLPVMVSMPATGEARKALLINWTEETAHVRYFRKVRYAPAVYGLPWDRVSPREDA